MRSFLKKTSLSILGLALLFLFPGQSYSQSAAAPDKVAAKPSDPQVASDYLYETPTRVKFSRLYWALDMLDIMNDQDIDNYLQFNECDIYKAYHLNEFEWNTIRESTREFLKANKKTFSLRFEIVQPLFLGKYNVETQAFDVVDEYKIRGSTRIEIMPHDIDQPICLQTTAGSYNELPRYPAGVIASVNRPLNITQIPVPLATAKFYTQEKDAKFTKLGSFSQTEANLYRFRDAYIFIRIKFFSYKNTILDRSNNMKMAELLGVLEGFEIYADKDKKFLLWSQDFRKHKQKKADEEAGKVPDPAAPASIQDLKPVQPMTAPPATP